jgi:hypothetical protein
LCIAADLLYINAWSIASLAGIDTARFSRFCGWEACQPRGARWD